MCNALLCLAIWMSYGARSSDRQDRRRRASRRGIRGGRVRQSIANIYYVPLGLLIKSARESRSGRRSENTADFLR